MVISFIYLYFSCLKQYFAVFPCSMLLCILNFDTLDLSTSVILFMYAHQALLNIVMLHISFLLFLFLLVHYESKLKRNPKVSLEFWARKDQQFPLMEFVKVFWMVLGIWGWVLWPWISNYSKNTSWTPNSVKKIIKTEFK